MLAQGRGRWAISQKPKLILSSNTQEGKKQQTASSLSFSLALVRTMHARGSGEASRRSKRGRAWPFACLAFCSTDYRKKRDWPHQSRAWPFACLAFCLTDYRKKRDCWQFEKTTKKRYKILILDQRWSASQGSGPVGQ